MVTGASSGLGAARRLDRLESLCAEINRNSTAVRAVPVLLDVSADGPAIQNSVANAWAAFGWIDALVNNAGMRGKVASPLELAEEEWDKVFKTNLKGTWLVSKYVCLKMRDSGRGGSLVNISSITGLNRGHLPGSAASSASKAALNTLTKI